VNEINKSNIENVLKLEAVMQAMTEQQVHIEPKHYFAPGLYMRSIDIPAGVTLTGKIHKTEHFCIVAKGDVSVMTDDGVKRLTAGAILHCKPGIKRAMFAHCDSVWINVHCNDDSTQDLEKIESKYVVDTFDQLLEFQNNQKLLMEGK
jgi:quercetin dioxygenase-like cupin family protein